ncbi:MAG: hypothetical protein PWQ82_948 [Thermosediminibacterales bacterium]|nr:hypothetical protein [Thermosediminibacterales bacterium]MDK2836846.1 hypothetical protein [Thermosediminibacterales bacterium]
MQEGILGWLSNKHNIKEKYTVYTSMNIFFNNTFWDKDFYISFLIAVLFVYNIQ